MIGGKRYKEGFKIKVVKQITERDIPLQMCWVTIKQH